MLRSTHVQVVAADSGLAPPLSWRNPRDSHLLTAERLHHAALLRRKASAVMQILAAKCGHDAFVSKLRWLLQKALEARQRQLQLSGDRGAQEGDQAAGSIGDPKAHGAAAASGAAKADVLTTAQFMRDVAQVRHYADAGIPRASSLGTTSV